jgi:hypothetical protein
MVQFHQGFQNLPIHALGGLVGAHILRSELFAYSDHA